MTDSIILIQDFIEKYPNSRYLPLVRDMEVRFVLGQNELNKSIANVYRKNKYKDAEQMYMDRIDTDLEKATNPKPSKIPWYLVILSW